VLIKLCSTWLHFEALDACLNLVLIVLPELQDNKKGMISTLTNAIANCSAVLNAALAASGSSGGKSDKMEVLLNFNLLYLLIFGIFPTSAAL